MKTWQDFLDSLSTIGGNIVVASIVAGALLFVYIHVIHHSGDAASSETIKDLLIAFAGADLALLKGNSSRQQMTDRNEAAAGAPKVDASKAQTVNVASTLEQNKASGG